HAVASCGRDVARAHAVYARVLAVCDCAGRDAGDRSVEIIFVLSVETQTVCLYAVHARCAVCERAGSRAAGTRAQLAIARFCARIRKHQTRNTRLAAPRGGCAQLADKTKV